jgi:hypothetical protein
MLLHVILHGIRWNVEPPTRWIPDALFILRREGSRPDWERVIGFAESQRLTYRLGLGLGYLAERHTAPVPREVLMRLRQTRTSLIESMENTVVLHDRDRLYANHFAKQWVIFVDFCRCTTAAGPIEFIVGLSHYMRYRWRLRGRMELVTTLFRGLTRRIAKIWS